VLSAANPAETGATLAELIVMSIARITSLSLSLAIATGLAACASGSRDTPSSTQGSGRVTLNAAQTQAIEGGVRQMVEREDNVIISSVTASRQATRPGLQVCGFVATPDAGGKRGKDLPFYIELLETDGKPVAERGQVGSDPSRLSKVNFMCRLNG